MAAALPQDLKQVADKSMVREVGLEGLIREDATKDEIDIARWGKRQQLRRNFGMFSILALTVTLMETWEAMTGGIEPGYINGGFSGLVYGYLLSWVGVTSQVLVTAELGSMIPLAGGQYNWVALLAPSWCAKFLSYLTGWMTLVGWQASLTGGFFGTAGLIQGVVIQCTDYVPKHWHSVLMSYAAILLVLFINTTLARHLPRIESAVFCLHIFGFLTIITVLTYFAPHASAKEVFANLNNGGGWQTNGLSFFIGQSASIGAFIGSDGACHMAEELVDARRVVPRSMIGSVIINGTMGFAMIVAIVFCFGDPMAALETGTNYPIIEIFHQAVESNAGTAGLAVFLIIAVIFGAVGAMAGTSRMIWAFARERGVPGYGLLSRVERRSKLPLYSIALTAIISALILLIDLGSSVVLEALLSITISGFYSAYMISAAVMLHKRLTTDESKIPWGPFRLGRAGVPITIFMLIYTAQGLFFSFWPVYRHVTIERMNWGPVVFGGALVVSLVFWLVHGRHVYKGPIVEVHMD